MTAKIHRSEERGKASHGWLESRFSFSFAEYFDRSRMHFGELRVVNDDVIAPASGFPTHPHSNMEILTIVTRGALEHKDSIGNGSVIRPGEVQMMSAGRGILHSEWNPSETEEVRLFQIWIQTRDRDIDPEYGQTAFDFEGRKGELITVASGDRHEEGLTLHQDAWIKRGILKSGQTYAYDMHNPDNGVFLLVIDGEITADGNTLYARDEITFTGKGQIEITAETETDIILMEVPVVR